jgi:hypothetical protein
MMPCCRQATIYCAYSFAESVGAQPHVSAVRHPTSNQSSFSVTAAIIGAYSAPRCNPLSVNVEMQET